MASLEGLADSSGKTIFAYSATNNALGIVVQADGASSPMSIDAVRNSLYNAGFNNAIAFDGSSSSTLVEYGKVQVSPAPYKNGTIDVGIGIERPGH